MLSGDITKTSNYTISYWWEASSDSHDRKLGGDVGLWIGKNSRALDKQRAGDVLKTLAEQFPYLTEAEAKHVQLQSARWRK
jgi:hypothetical protein